MLLGSRDGASFRSRQDTTAKKVPHLHGVRAGHRIWNPVHLPRWRRLNGIGAQPSRRVLFPGRHSKSLGACEASRPAARSPPPVIWSGLVVIQLLHQQVMIDDHAAVRDWTALTIAAIRPGRVDMRLSARRLPAIRPARLTARRPSRKDGRRGPSVSVGKLARLNSSRGSSIDRLVEVRISI